MRGGRSLRLPKSGGRVNKTLLVAAAVVLGLAFGACAPGAQMDSEARNAMVSKPVLDAVQLDSARTAVSEWALGSSQKGRQTISVSFFAGHIGNVQSGSAHWTNSNSNDSDPFSIVLDVPEGRFEGFLSSFAGINFHHLPGAPPAVAPSFDFKADRTADSGGSPRLVMQFSDAGNINLRPLAWVQDTWISEGPGNHPDPSAATNWDNNGGTCAFLYETTYQTAVACHAGATVTAAYIVSDSGWLNGPYRNWIDNIQYDGTVISQPSDNGNR